MLRGRVGEEKGRGSHEGVNLKTYDFFTENTEVTNVCDGDMFCLMDHFNHSIMDKTEITNNIYKFITHRIHVIKEGFVNQWDYHFGEMALEFINLVLSFFFPF